MQNQKTIPRFQLNKKQLIFPAKQRLWVHHLFQPRRSGPSPHCSFPHFGREEDRPETRHAQVQEQGEQNKEDFRRRSEPRNLGG